MFKLRIPIFAVFAEEHFKATVFHTFFKNLIGKQTAMKTHMRQMEQQQKWLHTIAFFLDYYIEREIKHWHRMHFF